MRRGAARWAISGLGEKRSIVARAVLPGLVALLLGGSLCAACIGQRPQVCQSNADCAFGTVCGGDGFCTWECAASNDCPCGSFCSPSCGLCIRNDFRGPATCFAFQNGLDTDAVRGACRADFPDGNQGAAATNGGVPVPQMAPNDAQLSESSTGDASLATDSGDGAVALSTGSDDSGECTLPLLTLPMCVSSPPIDAQPVIDSTIESGQGAAGDDSGDDLTGDAQDEVSASDGDLADSAQADAESPGSDADEGGDQ